MDAFLRENRVLPPILALLTLFVVAWIVAGSYIDDEPEGGRVSNQTNVANTQDAQGQDPVAPEAENRDVDSYAAYRNKDPFRQLLALAEDQEDTGESTDTPADETTDAEEPTTDPGGGTTTPTGRPRPDGGGRAPDPDDDVTPNRPEGPADRRPDREARGQGGDPGAGRGNARGDGRGRDDADGRPGRNDDLLESGGSLSAPFPLR